MTRQFENPKPSLFDEDEPGVELAPAQKIELATLVRALLLEIERSADEPFRDLKQLFGKRYQLFRRQAAMALVHGLGQRVGNASADPHHGGLLDAELHGDGVGGLKADAADVSRQAIRVLGHDLDGVGTICLANPYRPRRADTVA